MRLTKLLSYLMKGHSKSFLHIMQKTNGRAAGDVERRGILPCLYRAWADYVDAEMSARLKSLDQKWLAFGKNIAAANAAYDIAPEMESASARRPDGNAVGAMMEL